MTDRCIATTKTGTPCKFPIHRDGLCAIHDLKRIRALGEPLADMKLPPHRDFVRR